MDLDISSNLLKRLCCHVSGLTGEKALEQFQLAVLTLNENINTEPFSDGSAVSDSIKRWLVHENRLQDATQFSFLFSKLQCSNVLRNKGSILHLFMCLRQNSPSSSRSGSEISAVLPVDGCSSMVNGHQPFRTPSLHSSISFGSSESYPSSSSVGGHTQETGIHLNAPERREREIGGGRVARLAAMYKSTAYTDVTEDVLIREILFAFQGIEGKVIKRDLANDCFRIDPKIRLSFGQRDLVEKLIEIGWLYSKVKMFCETQGRHVGGGSVRQSIPESLQPVNSAGLVNQSLVLAFKEELNEYCRLIAVLESQMHEVSGAESPFGESSGGLTLRRLLLWTLEPRCRLRTLALLTHSVKDLKGGGSASAIYQHLHHGDASHVQVVRHALSQSCRPLFVMLMEWLLDGNLQDPHHEFFVAEDPTVPNERLWHDKYDIRWSMLPSFISHKQAQKVLATGKSFNFLRNVCNFKTPIGGREAIMASLQKTSVESMFNQNENNNLEDLISLTFRTTFSYVLEEMMDRHRFMEHLTALKRYLLLGQGDFIHYLMEILEPELSKPASALHSHNLSFLLETAIAGSNAQYEEPDILKRLDIRLLEFSPGETGWDVFSLDYHVDGPIGTVFTADCMRQYLMLFNSLWRAKHMECILSATWKQQGATSKLCRALPELGGALHRIQLLLAEMIQLVQQMAYYMTFEVLECGWHDLLNQLSSAQSLDDVIGAHARFLKKIVAGALLDEESRDVRTHLRTLYDLMVRLEGLQERLYHAVVTEVSARRNATLVVEERTKAGQFGTTAKLEEKEQARREEFTAKFVPGFRTDLRILTQSYHDMVQAFLLMLVQHEDENLHLLGSRLDFNEHYHRKDHRLNMRLTYLHKRKSMVGSLCQ